MSFPEIAVRHVRGRYPHRGVFRSENIVADVTEVARVFRIRLDDVEHPDAWMEITVEIGDEIIKAERMVNDEIPF